MKSRKTILIVDDHPLVREGIKNLLAEKVDLEVVGEVATGRQALKSVEELCPDLVLMDISLPDLNGLEVTRQMRSMRKGTAVMIISMHSRTDYIVKAFQAGAIAFIVKESPPEKLLQAIQSALNGDFYLDSRVSHKVIERLMSSTEGSPKVKNAAYESLTEREQEITALLAEGLTNFQVADRLFISLKTVKNHRTNIMQKLGLHSTYDLIRYAARIGLIDIDTWRD